MTVLRRNVSLQSRAGSPCNFDTLTRTDDRIRNHPSTPSKAYGRHQLTILCINTTRHSVFVLLDNNGALPLYPLVLNTW